MLTAILQNGLTSQMKSALFYAFAKFLSNNNNLKFLFLQLTQKHDVVVVLINGIQQGLELFPVFFGTVTVIHAILDIFNEITGSKIRHTHPSLKLSMTFMPPQKSLTNLT